MSITVLIDEANIHSQVFFWCVDRGIISERYGKVSDIKFNREDSFREFLDHDGFAIKEIAISDRFWTAVAEDVIYVDGKHKWTRRYENVRIPFDAIKIPGI